VSEIGPVATSLPVTQGLDQHLERRRLPAPARIVQVVAGERRAPVGEHPNELAAVEVRLHFVLGQVRDAEAGKHRLLDQRDRVEHQLTLHPNPDLAASLLELPGAEAALGSAGACYAGVTGVVLQAPGRRPAHEVRRELRP
jgi:hypothetical protein